LPKLAPLTVEDDAAQAMTTFATIELDERLAAQGFIV
jgi:hypothetical protein